MKVSGTNAHRLLVVVAAIVAIFGTYLLRQSSSVTAELPDLALQKLSDPDRRILTHELLGAPGVLNFWASWCVACRVEHPVLMNLGADANMRVFGVNFRDDRGDALRWIDFYGDPYRFSLVDGEGELGKLLDVDALPVTYVFDANGNIAYRHLGPLDSRIVDEVIAPLVDGLR